MSYILEALRKSQQERDLGQVPTLETLPAMVDTSPGRVNYWGVAAVSLAGLAVIIALYAAMRGSPGSGDLTRQPAVSGPPAHEIEPAPPVPRQKEPEIKAPEPPSAEERAQAPVPPPSQAVPLGQSTPAAIPASGKSVSSPEPTPSGVHSAPPENAPAAAPREKEKIPADLRQEIEEFKQQVLEEQGGSGKKRPGAEPPPQELRLPPDVKDRLPAFLMTVHIFDADPDKRFVLINARKLREGDRTRKDVVVEEILPDGVVLSYEGHRFFRHR
jgi:general secretion pathway protein B